MLGESCRETLARVRSGYALPVLLLLALALTLTASSVTLGQTIYVDTSAIDAIPGATLTDAEKAALKQAILDEIKKNLSSAFGEGLVVTNVPANKDSANRTVNLKNQLGTFTNDDGSTGYKWGDWPHGSSGCNVYLKNYMERWKSRFQSGDPPTWDITKLGTAIGTTAAHETAHSFSAGHDDNNTNKMNTGNSATQLGGGLDLNEGAKRTLQENKDKAPCATVTNYSTECFIASWWSDPNLEPEHEVHEQYAVTTAFSFGGALANAFDFGWWGVDTDNGATDGNPWADFVYKSSMTGTLFDSPTITFFDGWTAHFVLRGRPGTRYEKMYFPVERGGMSLMNPVVRPDGREVGTRIALQWDVDGIPGPDVQADMDTHAYGAASPPYNGFILGPAQPLTLGKAKLRVDGTFVAVRDAAVSRIFDDYFYVQSTDSSSGIRVRWSQSGTVGEIEENLNVTLAGKLASDPNGERVLAVDPSSVVIAGYEPLRPQGMPNRSVGGADYNYQAGLWPSGQSGIYGAVGINNIGLLLKVWGKIIQMDDAQMPPKWFKIDDGSKRDIKVFVPPDLPIDPIWQGMYVVVTGISSCEPGTNGLSSLILPKHAEDVVPLNVWP